MKKLAIMAALAVASLTASAAEFSIHGGRNFGSDQTFGGFTIGQKMGIYQLDFGFDHASHKFSNKVADWNRYSLVAARDLGMIGKSTVSLKGGLAVVDPSVGPTGTAVTAGLGLSVPLAPRVSWVSDLYYQKGENKIKQYDGGVLTTGLNFSF